ncbi:M50 family metallopeptidase [Rhodococcoides fascians]|uniref:M50 family metallopeptidase n=1 Tax=Rhodococcoides fascians TaxID=1828 RepID=UPI000A769105|nr:M50 family metallopeptidase [Rhodococcus fascians]
MKLSDLSPAEHRRIEVSIHEAGHAVQAVLAGGRIVEVKINDGDLDTPGHCLHVDVPGARLREVSYAGPWAESRWRHGERPRLQHVLALLASNASDCDDVVWSD